MSLDMVKFPELRAELLQLGAKDQAEIRNNYHAISQLKSEHEKENKYLGIAIHSHIRAKRLVEILNIIKNPTVENIGMDGSGAVSLLALHSYLELLKKVLKLFEENYAKNPKSVSWMSIPSLIDRVNIVENRQQIFGTNWSVDRKGTPFLIKVKDFSKMNNLRAKYDLEPARKPVNLAVGAVKYPLGRGLAVESDQKDLTDEEYEKYTRYFIKSLA